MTFFNPNDYPFEILGVFEEFTEPQTGAFIGIRDVPGADRLIGSPGTKEIVLTENLTLRKPNLKATPVLVKASKQQPRTVLATLQLRCGKLKEKQQDKI